MTARKNRIRLVGALLALVLSLSLVGCAVREGSADDGRLRVVTTLFPYYDFARAVAGDRADVTLLLAPGREAHSFEPTPLDAVTISRADVFIYNGGEGEVWADDMLDAVGEDIGTVLRMMDFVDAREEEFSEGMQGADSHDHAHDHDHDHELHDHAEHDHDDSDEVEYDEHIWTSPKNAIRLCRVVADALCAADGVLIPIQCEYFALEGVSALMGTVQKVQKMNRHLAIEGVVLTMLDARTNLGVQVAQEVRKVFKNKVYQTVIPRNVRLGEAPSHGLPISLYDPRSLGAQSYQQLAKEFLARE